MAKVKKATKKAKKALFEVKKSDAVKVLAALGFSGVSDWTIERIGEKIDDMKAVAKQSKKKPAGDALKLMKAIIAANEAGKDIGLVDDDEEETPKKKDKKAAAGKKGGKKAAEDDDEEEEESDEEEEEEEEESDDDDSEEEEESDEEEEEEEEESDDDDSEDDEDDSEEEEEESDDEEEDDDDTPSPAAALLGKASKKKPAQVKELVAALAKELGKKVAGDAEDGFYVK